MDRFIDNFIAEVFIFILNLKSNMDRFIGSAAPRVQGTRSHLKSNMDRFIVYLGGVTSYIIMI